MSKSIPGYKRDSQQNKSFVDRSKFKCYNCGIVGHFSNECMKPKTEKKGNASDGIDYKRKYYDHLRTKEKAFVSEEKDCAAAWKDSDEEEFINLALMATLEEQEASSAGSQVLTSNLSGLSKKECKSSIDEISNELYNLHVSLKSLTRENARIKNTNDLLLERNALLENELFTLEKCKKECQIAKDELILRLKREETSKKHLDKEFEVISKWTKSAKVSEQIKNVQGKSNFLDHDSVDIQSAPSESTDDSSTDIDYPSTSKISMDMKYLLMKGKMKQEKKLAKLKKKYGHLNSFVKQKEGVIEEAKPDIQQVNVGYLSGKKLKDKLEHIETKVVPIPKKNKNRNGKVGINKNSKYSPDKHAPRKVCSKCGSSNHLAMQCKNVVPSAYSKSMTANVNQNFSGFSRMPFLPNPLYLYGNASITPMSWGNQTVNNHFAYIYPENESKSNL